MAPAFYCHQHGPETDKKSQKTEAVPRTNCHGDCLHHSRPGLPGICAEGHSARRDHGVGVKAHPERNLFLSADTHHTGGNEVFSF
jgi:hypothetical protein